MIDLSKCRNALPLPQLMDKMGFGDRAKAKAKCPWHDDQNPSFGIYVKDRRYYFKCHAGCGDGDEVDFIAKALDLRPPDAIRRYAEFAGVEPEPAGKIVNEAEKIFNGVAVNDPAQSPAGEQARIAPLTPKQIEKVAEWRGLSKEFVKGLSDRGAIGMFSDHSGEKSIAFPVGAGVHYRKKDGSWRYANAKAELFVLGEIEEGAAIHCFESQWDALAFADSQEQSKNIVATRGAGNAKLVAGRFKGHTGALYLWPQNDLPGLKWAADIREALPNEQIKVVSFPKTKKGFKDLNEWRQNGATDGDIFNAFIDAKDFNLPGENPTTVTAPLLAESEEAPLATGARVQAREGMNPVASNPVTPNVGDSRDGDETLGVVAAQPSASSPLVSGAGKPFDSVVPAVSENCGAQLLSKTLDDIVEFLNRYVVFPMEEQASGVALWIAHAWTYEAFRFTPYLHICSPEKRCGKTRLLESIQLLVPRSRSFVRPSEAVLFRTIDKEHPTLLLDEIDTIFTAKDQDTSAEGMRGVLNAGFQKGATVPRCTGKDFAVTEFDVFCPKVIAGIGRIPDTVRDRSVEIKLVRQTSDLKAERFRQSDAQDQAEPIRAALEAWAKSAAEPLSKSRPALPEQLTDRQQDMCEPLFAIADMAGGHWPSQARDSIVALSALHEDQSVGVQLLSSCREIFAAKDEPKLTSYDLIVGLTGMESADAPWAAWWEKDMRNGNYKTPAQKLARILGNYEIKPTTLTVNSERVKGYYRSQFDDAWRRYLTPVTGLETMELAL